LQARTDTKAEKDMMETCQTLSLWHSADTQDRLLSAKRTLDEFPPPLLRSQGR
jgi:hypothetical protein